jgi:hypothetical protein
MGHGTGTLKLCKIHLVFAYLTYQTIRNKGKVRTYTEDYVVRTPATAKEKALAKVDHAFGQLRQMKDGELQGINAEDLLNEL